MESTYIVKVQHEGAIRRLTLARGEGAFAFEQLQSRIRDLFQFPLSVQFGLTYVDKDGDVVTMAEDEDLKDALVLQALNPLRVTVEIVNGNVKSSSPVLGNEVNSGEATEQPIVQGESIPATLSKSLPVEMVADAEPVVASGESVAKAEPSSNSDENSALPEENVSKFEGGSESKAPDVPSSEEPTEDKSQEETGGASENRGHLVHFGIQCDSCRMVPILGPRFVSRTKRNYDLCLRCYEASGAEEKEYAKIDRSFFRIGCPAYVGSMSGRPEQGMRRPMQRMRKNRNECPQSAPAASAADAGNRTAAESSTANSTPKVLHMGVQCDECGMHPLEGPRFTSVRRFNYDLCHSCFVKSGSNASEYSRVDQPAVRCGYPLAMRELLRRASPEGRLNPISGRWVWVMNRMVPILAPAAASSDVGVGGDAVNPPQAESAGESVSVAKAAAAAEVVAEATISSSKPEGPTEERAVNAEDQRAVNAEDQRAVNAEDERNVVQIPVLNTNETQAPVDVQFVSTENSTVNNLGETAGVDESVSAPAADGDLSTQEGLLAKLAAMGFEDSKLNEELLQKNNFDLRKSLDDLCAAEEWDPILGELQEMGFYDANMNRRLMFKNNGSVKRVVKELVQMYKGDNMA